ncbi:hypothetical protein DXG03_008819 [Asterophora parasitica]|uniref:Amidohydrolase-related domain-containing protein n=1 Tax=Asterophora parasitica TaxID=117018 RepID=A0A9P7G799_9AGAR|nr:hypothetical protein DXG03_008819 [Asterophora parasitica]
MAPIIFYGALISPESLKSYKALPHCLISVGASGAIDWLVEDVQEHTLKDTLAEKGCIGADVVVLQPGEFLLPGFIDTHTQFELLDWLSNVTFPMEAKFSDTDFARRTYESAVRRVIDCGTTTCCYYGTLHLEATKVLADIVHAKGQRAFIGLTHNLALQKCNMDRNCPESYVEPSANVSVDETKELISHIRTISSRPNAHVLPRPHLVQPILTPRFAISCTSELLTSLGKLAALDTSLHIQTHISENKAEIAFTKELFPDAPHYAGVYDSFGLLRNNTVLAHAVHLEDAEIELIAERKAGISHCPTSNFNLSSGVAPIGVYLDRGIKVGLGTDVSGGFSPSILNSVQHASIASKILALQAGSPGASGTKFADRQLSVATLLYLATLGGAEVCDIDKTVGSFAPGKAFDALLVNTRSNAGNPGLWYPDIEIDTPKKDKETLDGLLERFLFCGDDRNISRVYVQGRLIGGKTYRV